MAEIRLENVEDRERVKQISVPHVEQCYSWDCGLACVSMVLKHFNISADHVYTSDLDSLQCGENVWTIDLAYLLSRYTVSHHYYTITLGVDNNYSKQAYYCRSFDKESVRVNKAFDEAATNNVQVEKKSLTIDDIVNHLSTGNIVISLIDWTLMECVWCSHLKKACFCCLDLCTGYEGHYIVLCGYDQDKNLLFYKNPSSGEELCCSRYNQYDKARKSYGTDEDLLFVFRSQNRTSQTKRTPESPKIHESHRNSSKDDS